LSHTNLLKFYKTLVVVTILPRHLLAFFLIHSIAFLLRPMLQLLAGHSLTFLFRGVLGNLLVLSLAILLVLSVALFPWDLLAVLPWHRVTHLSGLVVAVLLGDNSGYRLLDIMALIDRHWTAYWLVNSVTHLL